MSSLKRLALKRSKILKNVYVKYFWATACILVHVFPSDVIPDILKVLVFTLLAIWSFHELLDSVSDKAKTKKKEKAVIDEFKFGTRSMNLNNDTERIFLEAIHEKSFLIISWDFLLIFYLLLVFAWLPVGYLYGHIALISGISGAIGFFFVAVATLIGERITLAKLERK